MSVVLLAVVSVLSAVSPDGRNEIRIESAQGLRYSVWRDGRSLLSPAPISLSVRGRPFSGDVLSSEPTSFSGTVETPLYKKSSVSLQARGCRARLAGGYGLELVARDDGVAYRFTTDFAEDEVVVDGESAPIVFPDGKVSVWAGYPDVFQDADKTYSGLSNWEPVYTNLTAAEAGLKADGMGVLPLVAEFADGTCLSITESDQRDYPGWVFRGSGEACRLDGWFPREPVEEKCTGMYHLGSMTRHDYIARTAGRRTYPWRLFQVAPCAAKLCEGDAVYALAEPCRLEDTGWIKPGLAQWEWWHASVLSGVPFKSGINTRTYLHYVDFAAEHGVPYVIIDGGWSPDYKIMNAKPAVDLVKIARHAEERGVGIILWSPWASFIGCQEEACRRYAEIGIKGFKLDGICRNDRYLTKYLEETARIAAKYRLVIDYHGVSKPTGLCRTYPNVLTFEGVHGLENTKWEGDTMPVCDFPKCDLTDYFCRMTAGPMDYTPGAMRNFATNEYRYSYRQPGSQGTRVRQLAMFTMFESPLQMLCDSPSSYRREIECFRFMSKVPTVWDETVGLGGRLADYAIVARRKGDVWYVGAMTDWRGRELAVPTGFLNGGVWTAEVFSDGANAGRDATDYVRTVTNICAGATLNIRLAPGGGWTAKLTPAAPSLIPSPQRLTMGAGVCRYPATVVEREDSTLPAEGYLLTVAENGVEIASSSAAGAFYARETLKQLASVADGSTNYPCCTIRDWPAYRWRGVLIDDCRHFFGRETVKRVLDLMAMYKLNVLHWHLTDDQGWRMDIPGMPELAKCGSVRPSSPKRGAELEELGKFRYRSEQNGQQYGPFYYTEADLREVVAYAAERHITIVPEVDLPGHMRSAIAAYPHLTCFPTNITTRMAHNDWGVTTDVLCVGNDDVLPFLEKVLDFVCDVFPSKVIHIGGDECPRVNWEKCPKCRARMEREGLKTVGELQTWITCKAADYLAGKGRRIMGWDEILAGDVPLSAIGQSWRTTKGSGTDLVNAAAGALRGHDIVVNPHTECYYNYWPGVKDDPFMSAGYQIPIAKAYAFDPMTGVDKAQRAHVLGSEACLWSEYIWNEYDLEWKMWPRSCAMAELLWTDPQPRDMAGFLRRVAVHRKRLVKMGVNCQPLE